MKAKDLISVLEGVNPDKEVLFLPLDSSRPEGFQKIVGHEIVRSFWGEDRIYAILYSEGQIGQI